MKVDQKGHTTIIKDTQNNVAAFSGKNNQMNITHFKIKT